MMPYMQFVQEDCQAQVLTDEYKVDDGADDCVEEDGAEVLHEDPVVEGVGGLQAGTPPPVLFKSQWEKVRVTPPPRI